MAINSWKRKKVINVNMIANYIDTMLATYFSEWLKTKFISKDWRIGQEEADNLSTTFEFDFQEKQYQMLLYQIEQDSMFFGVWILSYVWFDKVMNAPMFRAINPLSAIFDPYPSQTWKFDVSSHRYLGFMMTTTLYDLKDKSWLNIKGVNDYIVSRFNSETTLNKSVYAHKNNYNMPWSIDTCSNFAMDVYFHYTTYQDKKRLIVTDSEQWHVLRMEELKAITKEEKLNPMLVPFPIELNYYKPERENPFGRSIRDDIEDKQDAISVLLNASLTKAKKEAMWWTFLVNSRLFKNQKWEIEKPSVDTKYIYLDENAPQEIPIQNAIYELPESQIKQDIFTMVNVLENQARLDTKIDSLQQWLMPDKTMTKAEAQQIQANANLYVSLRTTVKSRFYKWMAYLRWRSYQENFQAWQKKFIALNDNFEWKWITFTRDSYTMKQSPYIVIGTKADIGATTEKLKNYMSLMLPQILQDPSTPEVSKRIAKRLTHRYNWLPTNLVNILVPYTPEEQKAKDYVYMINNNMLPKTLLSNPGADIFTYWLYIQKAEDNDIKEKVLYILENLMLELGQTPQAPGQDMWQVANSAANIQMSQATQWQGENLVTREQGALTSNMQ